MFHVERVARRRQFRGWVQLDHSCPTFHVERPGRTFLASQLSVLQGKAPLLGFQEHCYNDAARQETSWPRCRRCTSEREGEATPRSRAGCPIRKQRAGGT